MTLHDRFYRLVRLESGGLSGHDRHAYRTLGNALNAQKRDGSVAIALCEGIDRDIALIDGEWTDNPRVGYPNTGPYINGPEIAEDRLMPKTQPGMWFGQTFLNGMGTGHVWSGKRMLPVRKYRIDCGPAWPDYDGLYAASIAASYHWWETTHRRPDELQAPAVICIDSTAGDHLRRRADIPFATEYLMLLPSASEKDWPYDEAYVNAEEHIRPPRHLVPVAERTLRALERLDIHEPRPEDTWYYRWTEVTPQGVVAADRQVYTNPASCTRPPYRSHSDAEETIWAVCRTKGLPADAETVDGRPFVTDARRTAANDFERIVNMYNAVPGRMIVDDNGDGLLYDGDTLRRIENLKHREPDSRIDGQPAWIMSALKRAGMSPADVNVHGVLVQMTSAECREIGLPPETRGVLFLREGQKRSTANAIPLTREQLNELRTRAITKFNPEDLQGYRYQYSWRSRSPGTVPAVPVEPPRDGQTSVTGQAQKEPHGPEEAARAAATDAALAAGEASAAPVPPSNAPVTGPAHKTGPSLSLPSREPTPVNSPGTKPRRRTEAKPEPERSLRDDLISSSPDNAVTEEEIDSRCEGTENHEQEPPGSSLTDELRLTDVGEDHETRLERQRDGDDEP